MKDREFTRINGVQAIRYGEDKQQHVSLGACNKNQLFINENKQESVTISNEDLRMLIKVLTKIADDRGLPNE